MVAAVASLLRGGIPPAMAQAAELFAEAQPFASDHVRKLAEALAKKPWEEARITLPPGWENLTYDQYRNIRFNPDKEFWRAEPHRFTFDLFHPGFLYTAPVDIHVVDNGQAARIKYMPDLFNFGPLVPKPDGATDMHYAGLRFHYPVASPDRKAEFLVFQGASYFRAVAKGLLYGLSARGLAINTGQPQGEEFPMFRAFWVRTPDPAAATVAIEALLDSPSVTGAFKFSVKPGDDMQMDVEVALYPRRDLDHVGFAPMTSMFLLDALARPVEDFRPAVHDSDGLMMHTGPGEWLWRPLSNRRTLQVSAFADRSPRGFGLMQRKRQYSDFLDLEAGYHRRPSLWAEPIGDWGAGAVELYEIPTQLETNDNIVALWQPRDALRQGQSYSYVYRLHWCRDWPSGVELPLARTVFSGAGVEPDYTVPQSSAYDINNRRYVIEFANRFGDEKLSADVAASAGGISGTHLVMNSIENTMRLSFVHHVNGIDVAELRAVLKRGDNKASETWLYRWTRN